MVEHLADYPWSSYHANGQGEANSLLSPQKDIGALAARQKPAWKPIESYSALTWSAILSMKSVRRLTATAYLETKGFRKRSGKCSIAG